MKNLKGILIAILCVSMIICTPTLINASTTDTIDEYFNFVTSPARINSDGSFDFRIHTHINSETFTTTSTSINLNIKAQVYDAAAEEDEEQYYGTRDVVYTVQIVSDSLFVSSSRIYRFPADNLNKNISIEVKKDKKYHISIGVETDTTGTGIYVVGQGTLKNIKLS